MKKHFSFITGYFLRRSGAGGKSGDVLHLSEKVKDVEIENLKVWCIGTTDGSQGGMRIPELLSMGYKVVATESFPYQYSEGGYTYDGSKLLLIVENAKFPNQNPAEK